MMTFDICPHLLPSTKLVAGTSKAWLETHKAWLESSRKKETNREFIVKDKMTILMVSHPYTPYTEQ